jgi:hypothetical protein
MTTFSIPPLTKAQKEIMTEFYKVQNTKVIFTKKQRDKIWDDFKTNRVIPKEDLEKKCPALLAELKKAIKNVSLIQSAVFSECVYAQTLANMLNLGSFYIFDQSTGCLEKSTVNLIASYNLVPRYVYKSLDGRRALVQAGGPSGIDSALIRVEDNHVITIEFKEPKAKTSEPDLLAYGEDGLFITSNDYETSNSQFKKMIDEQISKKLNFWSVMSHNVNDFNPENVQAAITNNYASKKFADVICVEDKNSYLTMIPANQVVFWADIKGEIRPAGRNKYQVWTPKKLMKYIRDLGGQINGEEVSLPIEKFYKTAKKRGGTDEVNRYKINPIFFVYAKDVKIEKNMARFQIKKIYQLKPTISAHMYFDKLDIKLVRTEYR